MADIQSIDFRGSALQKAIGKSSSRGANIQTCPASNFRDKQIQRCLELEPTSGNIRWREMLETDGTRGINFGSRLVDAVFVHQDRALKDQGLGLLAAFDKATVEKNLVNAFECALGALAVQFFGCTVNNWRLQALLRFLRWSELQAVLAVAAGLGCIVVLDEGPDLFVNTVCVNSILGMQQAGIPVRNETIRNTYP